MKVKQVAFLFKKVIRVKRVKIVRNEALNNNFSVVNGWYSAVDKEKQRLCGIKAFHQCLNSYLNNPDIFLSKCLRKFYHGYNLLKKFNF